MIEAKEKNAERQRPRNAGNSDMQNLYGKVNIEMLFP